LIAWVFLYGTLLDPGLFARMAGTRRPLRRAAQATLAGFRRVTLRGTPYPTLLPGHGTVAGLVVPLPPASLARLHRYEGASYTLVPMRVRTPRGMRRVRAWLAPRWRADPLRPWPPRAEM
jgi:gamma-glutamylcyclotransferase (GGCT)/AIG2-like uncharacterized protein YtfP